MICPEGIKVENESVSKEEESCKKKVKKVPDEGAESIELNSYKSPKSWKKSITNFFRNSLRSTKSNDGERSTGSKENLEDKELSPEQKWQSLGKIFRRQSFGEHWNKLPTQQGESSTPNKRLAVRNVLSSYFGKTQKKSSSADSEK